MTNLKDKLMEYRAEGYSLRQLYVLGKALSLDVNPDDFANPKLTPKELTMKLNAILERRGE